MFCVGFGSSLTASAAVSPDAQNEWFLLPFNYFDDYSVIATFDPSSGTYNARGGSQNDDYLNFSVDVNSSGVFPTFQPQHTYLLYLTVSIESSSPVTFRASTIQHVWGNPSAGLPVRPVIYSSNSYVNSTSTFTVISQVTPSAEHPISTSSRLVIGLNESVQTSGRVSWGFYALDITDNSESEVNQIITAIQDQTSDLQQSIEDQYGGDPGSSFPVEDIITQHNEKMGVLSFSSEALMQVLGLLSPDQTLSSELVFPSMSLTIAGQRNKVQLWPEYRFDLNTLKQHWPDFVELMQSLTTALVWIFVLRYCYRVFEKYFLAGGGS